MKYLSIVFLVCITYCAIAQQKPSPVTKALLDTAKAHQKDNNYVSYLKAADSAAKSINDTYGRAVANQRMGSYYYSREPRTSLQHQQIAFDMYAKAGDERMSAICLHNMGFIYEEQLNNVSKATEYIARSIDLHRKLKDTMELANMYKYIGMLKARQRHFTEAKRFVRTAVHYFQLKQNEAGVAVSYYDMGLVFTEMKQYDSAAHSFNKAKTYWIDKDNTRVFGINNQLVKIGRQGTGSGSTITNLINENDKILASANVYWNDKLTHYKNAVWYCRNEKLPAETEYLKVHDKLVDSLKSVGIKIPGNY